MVRERRRCQVGYPHLVIAKSQPHLALFEQPWDYLSYLEKWRQLVKEGFVEVFAFCLQPKEVRLVLRPLVFELPRLIQRVHGSYTLGIHQKRQTQGKLFKERFHSCMFLEDELLEAIQSIHIWPVKKNLFYQPEHVPYSSYLDYISSKSTYDFLSVLYVLNQLNSNLELSKKMFEKYAQMALLQADWVEPNLQLPQKTSPVLDFSKYIEAVIQVSGLSKSQLLQASRRQEVVMARRLLAFLASQTGGAPVSKIGDYLEKDKSQASRLIAQGQELLNYDENFQKMYEKVQRLIREKI